MELVFLEFGCGISVVFSCMYMIRAEMKVACRGVANDAILFPVWHYATIHYPCRCVIDSGKMNFGRGKHSLAVSH